MAMMNQYKQIHQQKIIQISFRDKKKRQLNFISDKSEPYNLPFPMRELSDSLNKAHDTAVGPDNIHYQIKKNLPYISLQTLLDILSTGVHIYIVFNL